MLQAKEQFLEDNGFKEEGWSIGTHGILNCPCGKNVEDDGQCPQGHESPMKQMGLI